jgi:hypothetical protein
LFSIAFCIEALFWRTVKGLHYVSVSVPFFIYGDVCAVFWEKSDHSTQNTTKLKKEREVYASSYNSS